MVLKNLKMTLKRSISGVEVTRLYPEKIMDLPEAERGVHVLDIENWALEAYEVYIWIAGTPSALDAKRPAIAMVS